MVKFCVPPDLRHLTETCAAIEVDGATVGAALEQVCALHPGLKDHLLVNGKLRPGLIVSLDGTLASRGLREPIPPGGEIHILPAVGGG